MQSGTIDINAFRIQISGNNYIFRAGEFSYEAEPEEEEYRLLDGTRKKIVHWVDLSFAIRVGYLHQQLNASGSYRGVPQVSYLGVTGILNALKNPNTTVEFYPLYEDDEGNINDTSYEVIDGGNSRVYEASRAGLVEFDQMINMDLETPLDDYPDWMQ